MSLMVVMVLWVVFWAYKHLKQIAVGEVSALKVITRDHKPGYRLHAQ